MAKTTLQPFTPFQFKHYLSLVQQHDMFHLHVSPHFQQPTILYLPEAKILDEYIYKGILTQTFPKLNLTPDFLFFYFNTILLQNLRVLRGKKQHQG